jgi:diguanylate cyclase (GGDEF)-like protein
MKAADNAEHQLANSSGEMPSIAAPGALGSDITDLKWGPNPTWQTFVPALLLVAGVAVVAGIARLLPVFFSNANGILRIVLAGAAVCLAVAMTLRHRRQWVLPAIQMRELIHEIRMGRAPLEDFSNFHSGSLPELAAEVKLVLQDLRQQRQAVADMKDEVRQRIAHQHSVLERTVASLRNQAVRDPLTGLYNRRMLDQILPQLITQLHSDHKSLTLMILDLDYFKKLNDTLGHAAGDEVLKSVGQIIHSTIRDGDFGCRYGGDEFVLLLPACEESAAQKVAERLQSLVATLGKNYKLAESLQVSMGISNLTELSQPTAAELLKKADERLYKAKSDRRKPATTIQPQAA